MRVCACVRACLKNACVHGNGNMEIWEWENENPPLSPLESEYPPILS